MDIYEQIKAMTRSVPARQADRGRPSPEPDEKTGSSAVPPALRGLLVTGRQLEQQRKQAEDERGTIVERLGAREITTPAGSCLLRETHWPCTTRHGADTLAGVRTINWSALLRLLRVDDAPSVDPARVAIVDTETTGLAGGTGTFAFLVGLGFLESDGVVVQQYFMRDYCEEPAQLAAVSEALVSRGVDTVVSFNGKAFDLPLLASRFIQNRMRNPVGDAIHLDLLHAARRLWRARLGTCDLGSVEREVLGLVRQDDVPGSLIPLIYFDFLRGLRTERMIGVFEHNALDLVSLAALLAYLSEWDQAYLSGRYPALDRFCLGRSYETGCQVDRATEIYEQLLGEGFAEEGGEQALLRLAIIYKRLGHFERAISLWQESIRKAPGFNPIPYVELAKYYEHRAKDLERAQTIVEEALAYVELDTWIELDPYEAGGPGQPVVGQLQRRLQRIIRKRRRQRDRRPKTDA